MNTLPSSVYRIQFSSKFSLKDATALIPYLQDLGVDGIYCSPIFESATDNGYDVVNPNKINPLLGTNKDFEAFCSKLKSHNMAQILDIVPNHMGIKGSKNSWWMSVLSEGKNSPYASFFDIYWEPPDSPFKGKILLPILKKTYQESLENHELSLVWDEGFWICYADYKLPIASSCYAFILETPLPFLPSTPFEEKERLLSCVSFFNRQGNLDFLHELLERQFYRLSHWTLAGQEINYRRFFTINDLAALHMEKEEVFTAYHELISQLLHAKKIQGIRVDHPDGLYRPTEYFKRLKALSPTLIIAEKILGYKEALPENWPIDGSVGYDFLSFQSGVLIQAKNEQAFDKIYLDFLGTNASFADLLYKRKEHFLKLYMSSDLHIITSLLWNLTEQSRSYRDFSHADLQVVLLAIIASFPVYRTYIDPRNRQVSETDKKYVDQAIESAKKRTSNFDPIYDYIKQLLLLKTIYEVSEFVLRFEQLTASCMAKGLEDSTFFLYNRLIALCEVGCSPEHFGRTKEEFHEFNTQKLAKWPLGFLASSTHDTKYSEDVRMRLCVLSEIPTEWEICLKKWHKENQKYKTLIKGLLFPDKNTEYYLYQILLGLYPLSIEESGERVSTCFLKMLREAGTYTTWGNPSKVHEEAALHFLFSLLTPHETNLFYPSFLLLQDKINTCGKWNSLAGLLLKIGSCGIVDLYQGNEDWNYLWMDPDNRCSIDYEKRRKKLHFTENEKLFVTRILLNFRKMNKDLFLFGDYVPLEVSGSLQENIVAFLRRLQKKIAIIATGRFFTELPQSPLGKKCWKETRLMLPFELEFEPQNVEFLNVFTGKALQIHVENSTYFLLIADVFENLPIALLTSRPL